MGTGILYQLNFNLDADITHAIAITITAIIYLFASTVFSRKFNTKTAWSRYKLYREIRPAKSDRQLSIYFYAISVTATIIYFQLVGYNVFLYALSSGISGDEIKGLRLSSYSGDTYYAPGYFNQFKNILLPCAFLSLSFYTLSFNFNKVAKWLIIVMASLPVVIGLLGTGQRAFFVSFVIVAIIFIGLSSFGKATIKPRSFLILSTSFFIIFSASSFFLGRSENFTFIESLSALLVRIFNDNQESAVFGFRYIYSRPVQYGFEWMVDLIGILPNYRGSDLANIVHEIMFGTDRGTAPVSVWGSIYYNFGWPGLIILPIIIAYIYTAITAGYLKRRNRTPFSVSGYAYLFFVLGSWIASGPMQLINNGAVTVIVLLYIIKNWQLFAKRQGLKIGNCR